MMESDWALQAVTDACCEALGKQVQPAFIADEIANLRKHLADAALVEAELLSVRRQAKKPAPLVWNLPPPTPYKNDGKNK